MKPSDLKRWMGERNKEAVDVAAMTHVSLRTVERFLEGKTRPSRLVTEAFEKLITESAKTAFPPHQETPLSSDKS